MCSTQMGLEAYCPEQVDKCPHHDACDILEHRLPMKFNAGFVRQRATKAARLKLLQLLADVAVALVQDLAHGREPELVQEHHEQQELARHDGQRQVEVEDLARARMRGQRRQRIGERNQRCGLQVRGQLGVPACIGITIGWFR